MLDDADITQDEEHSQLESEAMPPESQRQKLVRWCDLGRCPNIAEELDPAQLSAIGMRVVREYEIDLDSRRDWERDAKAAIDMALQRAQPKSTPWPNASNVIYPMITEAADQFAARAYPAIIENQAIVKGVVYGNDAGVGMPDETGQVPVNAETGEPLEWLLKPGAKKARATRIGEHMSWQLLEEQPEWETETDTMLHVLPVVGCGFRKSYYDPVMGRNVSAYVSAFDLVVNYWAKSMETAPRKTERQRLYPYEIREYQQSGYYLDRLTFSPPMDGNDDEDHPHEFLEQHRRIDLDGDGYTEPYIVTVHKDSMQVARIVAGYDAEGLKFMGPDGPLLKIVAVEYYTKYDFLPNKEGGFYGHGFGHTLKSINESTNATLNMLFDAGHLQNAGGGFIGKSLSMHSGQVKFKPGEYKVVNAAGTAIRDAIVPLDHRGPSPVLFQLLGTLIEAGKSISSVKDVLTGEVRAQTMSPTVFMALVEQGLKVFTAIYKRIYRALKAEFDKLYRLNRIYLQEQASYKVGDQWRQVTREDYMKGSGVEPVADPKMVSATQRMAMATFLMEFRDDPMLNGMEIRRRALEAAAVEEPDKLLVQPQPDPKLLAQMANLELQHILIKAQSIHHMTQAVKNLADADKVTQEPFIQWAQLNLQMIQDQINGLANGTNGRGVQAMEAPPGDEGVPPIPGGLPYGLEARPPGAMGTGPDRGAVGGELPGAM